MQAETIRQYELLLMRRHRFLLKNVLLTLAAIEDTARKIESVLLGFQPLPTELSSVRTSAAKQPEGRTLGRVSRSILLRIAQFKKQSPSFLGESELRAYTNALNEFRKLPEISSAWDRDLDPEESGLMELLMRLQSQLDSHAKSLSDAVKETESLCLQLSQKRSHLVAFLDESMQVLHHSNTQQLLQFESDMETLMDAYPTALKAATLMRARQLVHEIKSMETSMSTMLLPHFEICRTITTASVDSSANAQVQPGRRFSTHECDSIGSFVSLVTKLKAKTTSYESVLRDCSTFVQQLQLFERAANQDAFVVCSSAALKLQFSESLDEELFRAYVADWKDAQMNLQRLSKSHEYLDAMQRVERIKTEILRIQADVEMSKQKLTQDDPTRQLLSQEVIRLFEEDGAQVDSSMDVLKSSLSVAS